jgi:hypothetical protein
VGGWYLEGGAPALVLLEVLKAKGRMTARVSMAPQPEAEQCRSASAMEECDECPTEMAGIAG